MRHNTKIFELFLEKLEIDPAIRCYYDNSTKGVKDILQTKFIYPILDVAGVFIKETPYYFFWRNKDNASYVCELRISGLDTHINHITKDGIFDKGL